MTTLHSMEIEQAVLSTLMTVSDSLNSLDVKPVVEDFYAARHQEIYKAIELLNIQGREYDVLVVKDYFDKENRLHLIGGDEYLTSLMAVVGSQRSMGTYIAKLKKLTECRKVEEAGRKIMELAQNTMMDDLPFKAQEIASGVESIVATDTRHDLQSSAVVALEVLTQKYEHRKDKSGMAYGVNTGLRDLDNIVGDIEPSHLCVIAAAPGGGKTTMAQMIAINAVKRNNAPTLFLSGEMAHYEVTNRIISALGRIPFENIKKGEMREEDYTSWVHLTAHVFPKYPLDIVDKAGITIAEIRGEIKKTIAKHGRIGCVIVDYLQLLSDPKYSTRFDVVTAVSLGLKRIAKDFKVPVIALSQLTKDAIGRKITMGDLRESGQIAQDADQIIMLYPDEKEMGVIVASVVKNRHGKSGEVRLLNRFDFCQFGNIQRAGDLEVVA